MSEINLENPIFVYYFDCSNISRREVESVTSLINSKMSIYTNITFWVVPSNFSKIECVFDGWKSNKYALERLSECLESIIKDPSLSEFKQRMRELLIDIINEEGKEKNNKPTFI